MDRLLAVNQDLAGSIPVCHPIKELLAQGDVSGRVIVAKMREKGYWEPEIRAAVWALVDKQEVSVNRDWTFHLNAPSLDGRAVF